MKMEDYSEYYIQGSDHYLIPKDVFIELFNEMVNWKEENKILKENAENNDKVVDKINWENQLLKKENKKLKDNWNKLKEYIKETKLKEFEKDYGKRYAKTFTQSEIVVCNMIMDKMLELEKGSDSNEI